MEEITAHENFLVLATMNPGGDYGKKELSPALRNRFTEIWVSPVSDLDELRHIASKRFSNPEFSYIVDAMINFWQEQYCLTMLCTGSELDWVSREDAALLREKCLSFLVKQLEVDNTTLLKLSTIENYGWGDLGTTADISCSDDMLCDTVFGICPFYIEKGSENCETSGFEFWHQPHEEMHCEYCALCNSQSQYYWKAVRCGKTSLIIALGKYSGHKVVRINLSEQTDLMDLLGSDLPVESDEGMKFAMGLNAILDHRAEVFIPELGLTFKCPSSFRVFACQNPFSQGGGRKGLPRSFLNRFTKVYIDELVEDDYLFISSSLYPSIPRPVLSKLIFFNKRLHEDTMLHHKFAQDGSPWEFNLRDVIRSCEIIQGAPDKLKIDCFLDIIYVQRMRTPTDRKEVLQLYEEVFGIKPSINPYPRVQLNSKYLIVGNTAVKRNSFRPSKLKSSQLTIMPNIRHSLEAALRCVQHQWLCILVGPPSSGKTSLIRLLAELTGNVLNELNLSSATDISELLGCFEQYDAYRNFRSICAQVECYVSEYCSLLLEFSMVTFCERKDSVSNSLNLLVEIIEQLKLDVVNNGLPVSWSRNKLDNTVVTISKLQGYLQRRKFSAKFEWVAGLLVKAIENGEWVLLENANLCNPTVLDRINSLVEPSGSITVNECGIVDGSPVVLHPHPNFRMFLTINPSYGEVSRAMRNRGVEIFMMQPHWLLNEGKSAEFELKDVKRFLVISGVPVGKLVESMAKAHVYARNEGLRFNVQITYLELARWIKLFQQLLLNGSQPVWSLQISWEHTYLSSLGLLRISYQQWNAQVGHDYGYEAQRFKRVLESLQGLEKEILNMLVTSPSYDVLIKLYSKLLDDHMVFWNAFVSSNFEQLLLSWHSIAKDVSKLHDFCPGAVENVLMMGSKHLDKEFHLGSRQSLLWIHGGHPILPSSDKLYHKQQHLLELCELIWPTHKNPYKQVDDDLIELVASSDPELRSLAVQDGACHGFKIGLDGSKVFACHCITSKSDEDDVKVNQQLEDMHQMLLERFGYEKQKLRAKLESDELTVFERNSASCCIFLPEILCLKSGFTSWQEALPLIDSTSFFLDMELLQNLSTIVLVDPRGLQQNSLKMGGYDIPVPAMLAKPVKAASVIHIVQGSCPIKDYFAHSLKLKVASNNIWQSPPTGANLLSILLSVARSLFQQIIHAHKRVFDADKFSAISAIFCSFQKNIITQDEVQNLSVLIASSSDQSLNSVFHLFIEPLLRELYVCCSSTDFHLNIGYAWLRIGGLRFSLLHSCHDMDPAMKYSYKHSQLEEKISLLELEIKVRQECDYLSGWFSSREADEKRVKALQMLQAVQKKLRRKMVFRGNPLKFNALRKECKEFLKLVIFVVDLVSKIEVMELQLVLDQVCNWQESVCSFMKFPRGYILESISSNDINCPVNFWEREINLLEKLVSISTDVNAERRVSVLQLKTALHLNFLVHVVHFVADAQRIDNASFKILDKIFNEFASMWMNMKVQVKSKEGRDTQQYKFRPRAFEIKHLIDVDISTFGKLLANENFSEWQELLSEDECLEKTQTITEYENLEEEWNLMQESVLNNMIQIHNQLFGSTNLALHPGNFSISEADRLLLFANSYSLGAGMIKGLGDLVSSCLDAKLMPEHLLRLCLEHERIFVSSHKSSTNYNFYKDSNASEMAKMVKLLVTLQKRVLSLLNEWEDHPGLQKIIDTVELLLDIPLSTPLAKALLGLRFLLNRAKVLEENGSKFSLSDQLAPIIALVCSWQKMEFDSWPALLNEVQDQYEINASKLWFPLFSVLHHGHAADVSEHEQSIIESLEEFINTSSMGEFRKRLQLLFAFLGQITAGRCLGLKTYSSPWQERNLEILYNVFGYYVQLLPRILEHIEANRRNIEMELKELLKLCRWERAEAFLSADNSKRTRQKLRRLIQKYTDVLQQPAMLFLNQDAVNKGFKIQSLEGPRPLNDISDKNVGLLNAVLNHFTEKYRLTVYPISNNSNWLFIQPSYDVEHLLLTQNRLCYGASTASELQCQPDESVDAEWKTVNEFYFKSMASVQLLQRICLKPHEDITYEQASRSVSFLNHLIVIQQSQRAAAYNFSKNLKYLWESLSALENLYSRCSGTDNRTGNECSISPNQYAVFQCLWKQKGLFDGLVALLVEESLLLRTVESTHSKSCQSNKPLINHVLQFIEKFTPVMQKSKESLDNYLVGRLGVVQTLVQESLDKCLLHRVGNASTGPVRPFVISKKMEQLVYRNFQVIKEFEEHLIDFRKQDLNRSSVIEALLGRLDDVLEKCSLSNGYALSEESSENITSWEYLFKSSMENLNVEELYDNLLKTIICAEKMISCSGCETSPISFRVGACFQHLHALSALILTFGDSLLQDLLAMHKMFTVLQRFGITAKDEGDDASHGRSQDATGTGMGEGSGLNDVSEQMIDEDQLLGTTEKPSEEQDALGEAPNKNDKGIEMEQDFTADTFSVSEDSEEGNDEDGDDGQLESAMGETGADSKVIDEKLWDKEEDETLITQMKSMNLGHQLGTGCKH
ncbi:hypothetical protein GH714_019259 [Hevea brasiliensis]|uniref:Midasin AAA lid domain-containing protein n=1 Tax=Hevea brasiliensis TaxID=3981 RepID=A0A6A6LLL5_HEVBR|nr:hypothetical protein GH714_019259 [Hevea brasiliensis]